MAVGTEYYRSYMGIIERAQASLRQLDETARHGVAGACMLLDIIGDLAGLFGAVLTDQAARSKLPATELGERTERALRLLGVPYNP
jgi:hypothetical protein